jgi:TolB-like protein
MVGAALVLAAAGAWFVFGRGENRASSAPAQSGERVPVLVHGFTASETGDRGDAELASGISDELIVRLRQIPELRIGSREATTAGGGALANAYTVDGNIRRDGDHLRVTAQLLSHDGEVVWSQNYDRTMSGLFAMQEQIASAIASALSVSLDVGANSSRYGGTDNPDAFAAFMQFKATAFSFDQSVPQGYLERAIALDPKYLKALSALSLSYSPQLAYASTRAEQDALLAKMDASTARMLAANPNVWMGHLSRATYYATRGDFVAAKKQMDLAQSLDRRTDPELPGGLATLDFMLGYRTKAAALVQSAEIIDPTYRYDPDVLRNYLYTGRYQDAIDLFDQLAQQGNDGRFNHSLEVFWAYMLSGREADGLAFASRNGKAFEQQAREFKADKVLPTLTMPELRKWAAGKYGEGKQFDLANLALLASYYGHQELAVNLMRLALERPGAVAALSMWQPAFAGARKTDGFAKLATDFGFVKLWRESGDWGDFCKPAPSGGVACR